MIGIGVRDRGRFANPDDYSFTAQGASKAEALAVAAQKLAAIAAAKPRHAVDVAQALILAADRLGLLTDSHEHDARVVISGYSLIDPENRVMFSSLAVSANLARKL